MNNIFEPLTLATGSHTAGSGMGCAMNVVSWENGDKTITDFPRCSDQVLAILVQNLNDRIGKFHGRRIDDVPLTSGGVKATYVIPADWSTRLLALAHMTVGTAAGDTYEEAHRWYRMLRTVEHGAEWMSVYTDAWGDLAVSSFVRNFNGITGDIAYQMYKDAQFDKDMDAAMSTVESIIVKYRTLAGLTEYPVLPVSTDDAVARMRMVTV